MSDISLTRTRSRRGSIKKIVRNPSRSRSLIRTRRGEGRRWPRRMWNDLHPAYSCSYAIALHTLHSGHDRFHDCPVPQERFRLFQCHSFSLWWDHWWVLCYVQVLNSCFKQIFPSSSSSSSSSWWWIQTSALREREFHVSFRVHLRRLALGFKKIGTITHTCIFKSKIIGTCLPRIRAVSLIRLSESFHQEIVFGNACPEHDAMPAKDKLRDARLHIAAIVRRVYML